MTDKQCMDIWIDCDPGIDDAVMLALAATNGDTFTIHGISSVAGNVSIADTTTNVLRLADYFGITCSTLAQGAARPLLVSAQDAAQVHGNGGLGGVEVPQGSRSLDSRAAIVAMRDAIMSLPDTKKMTLVPTGPLTNIALLLRVYPEVANKIERVVLMGGSTVGGNVTEYAEFNIWGDPEAARIVFESELAIVMCGLDVTLQCGLTTAQMDELGKSSNERERKLAQMLNFYKPTDDEWKNGVCVIHDAVTLTYLLHPELFGGEQTAITVDCLLERRGETTKNEAAETKNVLLLNSVDMQGFQRVLLDALSRL